MKTRLQLLLAVALCGNVAPVSAQPSLNDPEDKSPLMTLGGPRKIFGELSGFSAAFELQTKVETASLTFTFPGTIAALDGKRRIELDFGAALTNSNPDARSEFGSIRLLREKGMRVIFVLRPDKHVYWERWSYRDTYTERPLKDSAAVQPTPDVKTEVTKLGEETLDGHPCIKNRIIETDNSGKKHQSTVWNATDLKNFPLRIESGESPGTLTMSFKDVRLGAPDPALFEPPAAMKANLATQVLDLVRLIRELKNDRAATNSW